MYLIRKIELEIKPEFNLLHIVAFREFTESFYKKFMKGDEECIEKAKRELKKNNVYDETIRKFKGAILCQYPEVVIGLYAHRGSFFDHRQFNKYFNVLSIGDFETVNEIDQIDIFLESYGRQPESQTISARGGRANFPIFSYDFSNVVSSSANGVFTIPESLSETVEEDVHQALVDSVSPTVTAESTGIPLRYRWVRVDEVDSGNTSNIRPPSTTESEQQLREWADPLYRQIGGF